jgi:hypothetical protein
MYIDLHQTPGLVVNAAGEQFAVDRHEAKLAARQAPLFFGFPRMRPGAIR